MKIRKKHIVLSALFLMTIPAPAQEKLGSSHIRAQSILVEKDTQLEVLDWGGTGGNLVLLGGLGDDAHIFDKFAPKLAESYHVYGITRRGRGNSSKPAPSEVNYKADRLGEDVLAVLNALHLEKPVIAGHSLSGEELSYIGAEHPESVAGLVYMEAGYPYALYDQANGELELDAIALRDELHQFTNGYAYEPVQGYGDLIADLERVEKEVKRHEQETRELPPTPVSPRMTPDLFAIMDGRERFTSIHVPVLVIFGVEPSPVSSNTSPTDPEARRRALMMDTKQSQIAAWKRQVPSAHIALIPRATHYIFQSNEVDVLREIKKFIATLPPTQ